MAIDAHTHVYAWPKIVTPPIVDSYGVLDDIGLPGLEHVLRSFPALRMVGHSSGFWSEISGDVTREEKNSYPTRPVVPGGTVVRLMRDYPTTELTTWLCERRDSGEVSEAHYDAIMGGSIGRILELESLR